MRRIDVQGLISAGALQPRSFPVKCANKTLHRGWLLRASSRTPNYITPHPEHRELKIVCFFQRMDLQVLFEGGPDRDLMFRTVFAKLTPRLCESCYF